jgi:hypothetical protein
MMNTLYSLVPILYYIYHYILMKKRKSVLFEISVGKICYFCKEDIEISDIEILSNAFDKSENHKLCKSCNREIKITRLSSSFIDMKYKFINLLVSKKWSRFSTYLLISMSVSLLFEIFINYHFDLPYLNLVTSIHLIYLYFWHQRTLLTTIKKPSE